MDSADSIDVGDRIAHWRKAKGWSQAQLAKAVGVSAAAVYQWEGSEKIEKTTPSSAHVEKVASALGITMAQFYGRLPKLAKAS